MENTAQIPAFPSESAKPGIKTGMTLRDYFAAKAMAGLMVHWSELDNDRIGRESYGIADEMLKARESK